MAKKIEPWIKTLQGYADPRNWVNRNEYIAQGDCGDLGPTICGWLDAKEALDAYANRPVSADVHKLILEAVDRCDPHSDGERASLYGTFSRLLAQFDTYREKAGVSAETEETVRAEFERNCRERWDVLPATADHMLRRCPGDGDYEVFDVREQFAAFQAGRNSVSASESEDALGVCDHDRNNPHRRISGNTAGTCVNWQPVPPATEGQ